MAGRMHNWPWGVEPVALNYCNSRYISNSPSSRIANAAPNIAPHLLQRAYVQPPVYPGHFRHLGPRYGYANQPPEQYPVQYTEQRDARNQSIMKDDYVSFIQPTQPQPMQPQPPPVQTQPGIDDNDIVNIIRHIEYKTQMQSSMPEEYEVCLFNLQHAAKYWAAAYRDIQKQYTIVIPPGGSTVPTITFIEHLTEYIYSYAKNPVILPDQTVDLLYRLGQCLDIWAQQEGLTVF